MAPRDILYIDHEGGWGGASRSLYYLVSSLDRDRFRPKVLYRQEGPLAKALAEAGIAAEREPDIFNMTPRAATHIGNWIISAGRVRPLMRVAKRIAAMPADLVHFNYDGLVPIAPLLQRAGDQRPRVLHIRVMHPVNGMLRAFARYIAGAFDHVIFITENERDRLVAAGFPATEANHSVLYNPVSADLFDLPPDPPSDHFRVSFYGTLDHVRGADRMIEVAARLKAMSVNARIDLFGKGPRYRKFFILERDEERRLKDAIAAVSVGGIIALKGHTPSPEQEIVRSHLVVRASRGADPWGRDVIESMSLGTPLLASGSYGGFIEDGVTGFLLPQWSAERVAGIIAELAADPQRAAAMGRAARLRARKLFSPAVYASAIGGIYDRVLAGPRA